MIDFCYSIIQKNWKKSTRLAAYRAVKLFLNLIYPLYVRVTKPKGVDSGSQIIVSLTSFPARIEKVYLTVETLLRQRVRPQKVVLWLATEQFQDVPIPQTLRKLEKYGLDIEFCEDLRSHKKYYPSMKKWPEATIVTADDDTFYPESWLKTLAETAQQHPDTIVCMLAHQISFDAAGNPLPYSQWVDAVEDVAVPRMDLMPVGCEGVLYPPRSLHQDLFEKEFFMAACRNADDLWLKAMSLMKGTPVMTATPRPFTYANLLTASVGALNATNVNENENDRQLNNIMVRYPKLFSKIICEET